MERTQSPSQICITCQYFSSCALHYAQDCRLQGGKIIPRMKPRSSEKDRIVVKPKKEEITNQELPGKNTLKRFNEPIITKVVNWSSNNTLNTISYPENKEQKIGQHRE